MNKSVWKFDSQNYIAHALASCLRHSWLRALWGCSAQFENKWGTASWPKTPGFSLLKQTVLGAEKGTTPVGAQEHSEITNLGESTNHLAVQRNMKLVGLRFKKHKP